LWLNLGDSYASSTATGHGGWDGNNKNADGTPRQSRQSGDKWLNSPTAVSGLKPKDLCGIPWMVARALRDPYYTGIIKNESDRVWLAAMIDAEGCMFIHKRKAGDKTYSTYTKQDGSVSEYNRTKDTFGTGVEVSNTHESIVNKCLAITGIGSICRVERETKTKMRNMPLYRWNVRSNQCKDIVREVYPYLVGKQHQARILLGCPSSGADAIGAHAALMELHNGRDTKVDFNPPDSLYEKGWWLRQDIIWSKSNPMPESVTDRCTKAHEYIFLMSKSAKYYCDMDAIRELTGNEATPEEYEAADGRRHFHEHDSERGMMQYNPAHKAMTNPLGRNKRSVWTVTTKPFKDAHFATFPEDLIKPCVLAGCPEFVCKKCGKARERIIKKHFVQEGPTRNRGKVKGKFGETMSKSMTMGDGGKVGHNENKTTGWTDCGCKAGFTGGTVLDPFFGAGTTGLVAYKNRRHYIGIELNPEYASMAKKRIQRERDKYGLLE